MMCRWGGLSESHSYVNWHRKHMPRQTTLIAYKTAPAPSSCQNLATPESGHVHAGMPAGHMRRLEQQGFHSCKQWPNHRATSAPAPPKPSLPRQPVAATPASDHASKGLMQHLDTRRNKRMLTRLTPRTRANLADPPVEAGRPGMGVQHKNSNIWRLVTPTPPLNRAQALRAGTSFFVTLAPCVLPWAPGLPQLTRRHRREPERHPTT